MVMRYHPSLAIGHTYHDSDSSVPTSRAYRSPTEYDRHELDDQSESTDVGEVSESMSIDSDSTMDNMDDGWDNIDPQNSQEVSGDEEDIDDSEFLALHEMYYDEEQTVQ